MSCRSWLARLRIRRGAGDLRAAGTAFRPGAQRRVRSLWPGPQIHASSECIMVPTPFVEEALLVLAEMAPAPVMMHRRCAIGATHVALVLETFCSGGSCAAGWTQAAGTSRPDVAALRRGYGPRAVAGATWVAMRRTCKPDPLASAIATPRCCDRESAHDLREGIAVFRLLLSPDSENSAFDLTSRAKNSERAHPRRRRVAEPRRRRRAGHADGDARQWLQRPARASSAWRWSGCTRHRRLHAARDPLVKAG